MNLTDLKKTIKENAPAIVTAVIVFLLMGFYLAVVVPANQQKNDSYHKNILEEFNRQFNSTLRDYASQVDLGNLKDSIVGKASRLCFKCRNGKDSSALPFLRMLAADSNNFLADIKENVIIQSVHIDSVVAGNSEITIYKRINLEFSPDTGDVRLPADVKLRSELCCIRDTSRVDMEDLKQRLSGAIEFRNWVIYSAATKQVFLNKGIEKEEFDSVKISNSRSGVINFDFSDKRFYRRSVSIDGTNINFMLVGAISQEDFDYQAKRVNLHTTSLSILFVILLFLSIPLVKPLISSKKEKLTQVDFLGTTCAIGVLSIVLVCFSFNEFLADSYDKFARGSLKDLNEKVREELNEEFSRYYEAFELFKPVLTEKKEHPVHIDLFSPVIAGMNSTDTDLLHDNNFQNFFTFNSKGELVKDVSKNQIFGIRRNFSDRDYFKVFRDEGYNGMLTSVFSRYDNDFKFVYIRKNDLTDTIWRKDKGGHAYKIREVPDFSLSGFAFKPEFMDSLRYNVNNGYMLCNNSGRVILNSDIGKSLKEDIYTNSQKNYELSKILHGMRPGYFEMVYNGELCLFYAQKFNCKGRTMVGGRGYTEDVTDYPLYLLTYKKLSFTNSLTIYTIINGFVLSVAYILGVTFLVLLFSVFFHLGDLSVISPMHLYWMFPDNSRTREYIALKWLNFLFCVIFAVLFVRGYPHVLYLVLLSGINLAFFNFLFLNQRVIVLPEIRLFSKKRTDDTGRKYDTGKMIYFLGHWVLLVVIFGYLIPFALYNSGNPSFGLGLSLLSHFVILFVLRRDSRTEKIDPPKRTESNRPSFISYFLSVMSYHYILVPLIITFTLFKTEVNFTKNFNYSRDKDSYAGEKDYEPPAILKSDGKVVNLLPVAPPSRKLLKETKFDEYKQMGQVLEFRDFVGANVFPISLLIATLIAIAIFIYKLMNYYSGRFFFYELSEAYRLEYFHPDEDVIALSNLTTLHSPYSEEDLVQMELSEKLNTDLPEFKKLLRDSKGDSRTWLKGVPENVVSNQVKIQLMMMNHFETYRERYQDIWDRFSEEEKFVLSDFASDYFVNFRNRHVLLTLMKQGYIIADPVTGRLRTMNYGFRNFIVHLEENDPDSAEAIKAEEKATKGTYSKWRLPLLIIAVSGIVMFMYLNKASFNNVLLVAGSAVSALGLVTRFLNSYKQ